MVSEIEDLIENANRLYERGACEDGLKLAFEALKIAEENKDAVRLSQALGTIGNLFQRAGRLEKALQFYGKALSIQEKLAEINPHFNDWVAMTLNNLGNLLSDMGKFEDAKERYERALDMYEALLKTDPDSSVYRSYVAMTLNNLGALLSNMGKFEDAKERYERALDMYEALLKTDPDSSVYRSDVATTLNNLGALLSDMGKFEDAKERYERALDMYEALLKTDTENTIYRSGVVQTTLNLGQNNIGIGDLKERKDSLQYFDEAYKILVKKAEQFNNIGLKYESFLAFRLGLLSKLKYNARVIELEKKPAKRAAGYRECATLANQLADLEKDEEQKKKWSDTTWYYEGRGLVNDSIIAGFNREKLEEAVNKFRQAASCDEAYPCFCIYDALVV